MRPGALEYSEDVEFRVIARNAAKNVRIKDDHHLGDRRSVDGE